MLRQPFRRRAVAALLSFVAIASACGDDGATTSPPDTTGAPTATSAAPASTVAPTTTLAPFTVPGRAPLPGMPPLTDARNVYAATTSGLSPAVAGARSLVYVPNTKSGTVSVIDPTTYKVIDTFATGEIPQHVVPSWDLKTLWVNNNAGNTLTPIDPTTGKPGRSIRIEAPYNLYFTPDGKYAMVMEERNAIIAFRDASTPALDVVKKVKVPCKGVNHADFSPDGTYFIASCEFSAQILKFDVVNLELVDVLTLDVKGSMPQDVRLTPDGKTFLAADMVANGVWMIDGESFTVRGLIPTGKGAHGIYPSRDARVLYVSNRVDGSISVLDAETLTVTRTWKIPGGGSPDMGGVSADGKLLWLSGRNHGEVYVIDVENWVLVARIRVGQGPHGLAVFPQPGRYSLGHTGNYR
jgi:YVTN family beta-propeller protein